jgi:peptidoglycan hydrolase CwlO-like protein
MKTKDEYIENLANKLKNWSAEMDLLHAKAETASSDVKVKYHAEIDALRAKECIAAEKIKELKEASGEAWDSVKDTADHVWRDLNVGLADLVAKFK